MRSPTPRLRSHAMTRGPKQIASKKAVTAAPAARKEM